MAKPRKRRDLVIKASVWLKDEGKFTLLESLDHTPRPGEELIIEGERWQVVAWRDRTECERLTK